MSEELIKDLVARVGVTGVLGKLADYCHKQGEPFIEKDEAQYLIWKNAAEEIELAAHAPALSVL